MICDTVHIARYISEEIVHVMIQAPEMTYRQLCDYLFENKNVSHVKFKMAAVVSKVVAILGNRIFQDFDLTYLTNLNIF